MLEGIVNIPNSGSHVNLHMYDVCIYKCSIFVLIVLLNKCNRVFRSKFHLKTEDRLVSDLYLLRRARSDLRKRGDGDGKDGILPRTNTHVFERTHFRTHTLWGRSSSSWADICWRLGTGEQSGFLRVLYLLSLELSLNIHKLCLGLT